LTFILEARNGEKSLQSNFIPGLKNGKILATIGENKTNIYTSSRIKFGAAMLHFGFGRRNFSHFSRTEFINILHYSISNDFKDKI